MTPHPIRAAALAVMVAASLAGCGDRKPKPVDMAEVFPNLPLPPNARLVQHSKGEDAMQLVFESTASQAQVEAYYRGVFSETSWRLVSQAKDREGALVLLAEQQGPPLWVRIRPTDPAGTTVVELSGARVAAAPAEIPGS